MNQNHRIIGIRNWRDQRNRCERSKQSSPQSFNKMENTMFEALRKLGGYRIDYMNREIMGSSDALGFYILGNLPAGQPYSHSAKHSLLAGLIVLRDLGEIENLVAIYLEVNEAGNALRPAYVRMKQDMRSGMFRRLFVLDATILLEILKRLRTGGCSLASSRGSRWSHLAMNSCMSLMTSCWLNVTTAHPGAAKMIAAAECNLFTARLLWKVQQQLGIS